MIELILWSIGCYWHECRAARRMMRGYCRPWTGRMVLVIALLLASVALWAFAFPLALAEAGDEYTVNTAGDTLNIRDNPWVGAEVIGSLYPGDTVTLISEGEGWSLVSASVEAGQGYVKSDYLTLTELDAILDYVEPARGAQPISDFEFEALFQLRFGGSEGMYIDASIRGIWQDGGSAGQRDIGTIKTLREDMAAMLTMGQAVGALTWCARDYINSNIDDFAPAAMLAKWQQQRAERAAAQEAQKDADGD